MISGLHLYSSAVRNKGRCLDPLSLYKTSATVLELVLNQASHSLSAKSTKFFLADIQESTARAVRWKVKRLCLDTLKHIQTVLDVWH